MLTCSRSVGGQSRYHEVNNSGFGHDDSSDEGDAECHLPMLDMPHPSEDPSAAVAGASLTRHVGRGQVPPLCVDFPTDLAGETAFRLLDSNAVRNELRMLESPSAANLLSFVNPATRSASLSAGAGEAGGVLW